MTFTASNGVEVEGLETSIGIRFAVLDNDPESSTYGRAKSIKSYLDPRQIEGLREFFHHERDVELGRWRWPENPDYVVYPRSDSAVLVLFELHGEGGILYRRGDHVHDFEGEAARAYFEAHPERKPWEDAKPGEVWAVTVDHAGVRAEYGGAVACTIDRGDFVAVKGLMRIDMQDAQIIAARRIWPEPSDG